MASKSFIPDAKSFQQISNQKDQHTNFCLPKVDDDFKSNDKLFKKKQSSVLNESNNYQNYSSPNPKWNDIKIICLPKNNGETLELKVDKYETNGLSIGIDFEKPISKKLANDNLIASPFILNPFEFPRQQSDKKQQPEVSQFKATQRLYKGNLLPPSQIVTRNRAKAIEASAAAATTQTTTAATSNGTKAATTDAKIPSTTPPSTNAKIASTTAAKTTPPSTTQTTTAESRKKRKRGCYPSQDAITPPPSRRFLHQEIPQPPPTNADPLPPTTQNDDHMPNEMGKSQFIIGLTQERRAQLAVYLKDERFGYLFSKHERNTLKCCSCSKTVPCDYENKEFLVDDPTAGHPDCREEMVKIKKEQFKRFYLLKVKSLPRPQNIDDLKETYEIQFKMEFPHEKDCGKKNMRKRIQRALKKPPQASAIEAIDPLFRFQSSTNGTDSTRNDVTEPVEEMEIENVEEAKDENIESDEEEEDETNEIENDEEEEEKETELEKSLGNLILSDTTSQPPPPATTLATNFAFVNCRRRRGKASEGSRNYSCDQQQQQQPRECNASRDVCMESIVKEFDGGNIEQKTSNNDTIELDDNDDEEGIKYELGQDHPTTQHLQRLIKNEYLDDSIIMRVLQDLRMGMESVVLIDAIIWTDGFVFNFWGPRHSKPKGRAKLPTIPYCDEKWETAVAPINISIGNYKHWTLAVIKKKLKQITYFDPLKDDLPHGHLIKLLAIAQLMVGSPCDFVPAAPESFMQQTDGYNCGVIACLLARSYLLHLSPFWSPQQLSRWRKQVHDWIKNGETEPLNLGF